MSTKKPFKVLFPSPDSSRSSCRSTRGLTKTLSAFLLASATPVAFGLSLSSATYLGGSGSDLANAIAFDASKNIYIASATGSANFPGLPSGAFSTFLYKGSMQCVVTKLDPTATHIISSTIVEYH